MRIILEKTVQRFSTATDYVETLLEIIHQRRRISEVRGEAPQGTGNGLDRSERVVDLVAQYTNNFLPSQPFFPAQGFSRLGEHDKTMGHPILAEIGAANDPALLIVMKRAGYSLRRRALHEVCNTQFAGGKTECLFFGSSQQRQRSAVQEANSAVRGEGNDDGPGLRHHLAEETHSFDALKPLAFQRAGKVVDLNGEIAESISAGRPHGAKGKILFTQSGDNVGQNAHGMDDNV